MEPELNKALKKATNGSLNKEQRARILQQLRDGGPEIKTLIEETGCTDEEVKSGFFTKVASLIKGK